MLLQTVSATMAGPITNLSRFGMVAGAEIRGKLAVGGQPHPDAGVAYRGGIASLFSTHPSTEERIARLQAIARGVPPR
jgi:Zn-dependent protease with chaperone function